MIDDVVSAALSVVIALVVAFPLAKPFKRHPWVFYGVAIAVVFIHLWYRFTGVYVASLQCFVDILTKGYLAAALFAVVMFTGTMDERSRLRRQLQPIRAELSILSFVLAVDHVIVFLPTYLPRLGSIFAHSPVIAMSLTVALLLTVLYAVLSVTSVRVLRVRIPYRTWKALQRSSYLMVGLLWLHIVLALGRSAFGGHGSLAAQVALGSYTVVTVVYVMLRVRKAVYDRRAHDEVRSEAAAYVRANVTEAPIPSVESQDRQA